MKFRSLISSMLAAAASAWSTVTAAASLLRRHEPSKHADKKVYTSNSSRGAKSRQPLPRVPCARAFRSYRVRYTNVISRAREKARLFERSLALRNSGRVLQADAVLSMAKTYPW